MNCKALSLRVAAGLFAAGCGVPWASGATALDVSTATSANWEVSGGGATNATPDVINGSQLALTSNGLSTGTPVAGFSNAAFDGFWTASYSFNLPSGATGASLSYNTLFADDRAVLFLNGNQIASMGDDGPGTGTMVLASGGAAAPFTFVNDTSGTVDAGFNVGGANTLLAVINNTTGGINGALSPLVATNGSDFNLSGTITYDASGGGGATAAAVPVPPAAWTGLFTLAGITLIGGIRRRRRLPQPARATSTPPPADLSAASASLREP